MSIKIMSYVWDHSQHKGTELLLLLAYADFANDKGEAWPSVTTLAAKIRMSERNTQRVRQTLIESGELQLLADGGGRGKPDLMRIPIKGDNLTPNSTQKGDNLTPNSRSKRVTNLNKRVTNLNKRVTNSRIKGDIAMSPEPLLEPSIEPSIEPSVKPTNHARAQTGLVGFETQRPYPTFDPLGEDPTTNSQPTDSPPVRAGSDLTAFPPPPGLTPAQCLAFRLLAAPEVAAPGGTQVSARYEMNVKRWLGEHDPLWLAQHVAVWWDDYQRGKVDGIGALEHRIEKRCAPNRWPDSFLASAFYRRHYPLDRQAAQARDRAIVYTPHLVDPDPVLDALPAPLWDE